MKTIVVSIVLAVASGAAAVAFAALSSPWPRFVTSIDLYDVTLTPQLARSLVPTPAARGSF